MGCPAATFGSGLGLLFMTGRHSHPQADPERKEAKDDKQEIHIFTTVAMALHRLLPLLAPCRILYHSKRAAGTSSQDHLLHHSTATSLAKKTQTPHNEHAEPGPRPGQGPSKPPGLGKSSRRARARTGPAARPYKQ